MPDMIQEKSSIFPQLATATFARLAINTSIRMMYPFLPAFARGLGVTPAAIANLLAARSFSGAFSPLFGTLSERHGRRPIMVASMFMFAASMLVVVVWPSYWPLALALMASGLAKGIFDPTLQAYIGDSVPYAARGRAISLVEVAWSGGMLLGVPAVGFAIAWQGWQGPFLLLCLVGGISAVAIWYMLPPAPVQMRTAVNFGVLPAVWRANPVLRHLLLYVMLISMGHELFMIQYGEWMENRFTLQLTSLGIASGVIGVSELLGEGVVGWLTDRFGKRRIVLLSGLVLLPLYFIIAGVPNLTAALLVMGLLFFMFEMLFVGGIPLYTELVPGARGVVMSIAIGGASTGRALGDVVGPWIWGFGGMWGNAALAAAVTALALLVFYHFILEHG